MSEQPDIGDLVGTMRHAADILERKAKIAQTIQALRAEDATLNAEILATWGERVTTMQQLLLGFVKTLPPTVVAPPVEPPAEVPPDPEPVPEEVPDDPADPDTDLRGTGPELP